MRLLTSENGFTHVCGHRGHSIGAPENTLAAIQATKDQGGTMCEIDIVLTADDEIILLHDLSLERTTSGRGLAGRAPLKTIKGLDAGTWFDPSYAGETVPTLAEALELGRELDLGFTVEIKEIERTQRLIERLLEVLERSNAQERVIILSFDHVDLLYVRDYIPGIRTEGITHARHADFVAVARRARLDSLSIEFQRYYLDDARAIHEAGIAIRCHLPVPAKLIAAREAGLDFEEKIGPALEAGLIDSLSGDDVRFLRTLVDHHPVES
ncbi:MAG: glycerophosphodiester phosphodiesterase family protein [Pseudomonadota bacterium]